jgi:hypothetical protein
MTLDTTERHRNIGPMPLAGFPNPCRQPGTIGEGPPEMAQGAYAIKADPAGRWSLPGW